MYIDDRVYGKIEISEPVVLELINGSSLQRLKGVEQAGYLEPIFPGTKYSRFEHSIGDYFLLKKYGAPLEEQIAGLIHDVSHSVFSHVIDYILDSGSEKEHSHQDSVFDEYIKQSEIPEILKKYGIDPAYITDDSHFPLKENELPDICADRIDYSLRTACAFGEMENGRQVLDKLLVKGKKWYFKDFDSAKKYAGLFSKINKRYYASLGNAATFRLTGDCVKYALTKRYITETDLYTTDALVLSKIEKHVMKDKKLGLLFDRMNGKVSYKNDPADYDVEVYCKSRAIDPLFLDGRVLKRVSEVDKNWINFITEELKPKHYFIKFSDCC
jgi:hypothetical protein